MIKVYYTASDGYRESRQFSSLEGARRYATKWVGAQPTLGTVYAVSDDGVGLVRVEGATLEALFGFDSREAPPAWMCAAIQAEAKARDAEAPRPWLNENEDCPF